MLTVGRQYRFQDCLDYRYFRIRDAAGFQPAEIRAA
jgi:hypothetical protein